VQDSIFDLTDEEINRLSDETNIRYYIQRENFFKDENMQNTEEFLINVRKVPRLDIGFTLWMMDISKESYQTVRRRSVNSQLDNDMGCSTSKQLL
jgi:hypothetical protein